MTLRISRRDVEDAYRYADRALKSVRDVDNMSPTSRQLVRAGETLGTAAIVGYLSGRYGPLKVGNVPMDLAAGLGLHLAAFLGLGGKWDEHMHNVANGALLAYVVKFSVGLGTQSRAKAGLPPVTVSGLQPEVNPFPGHGNMPYGQLSPPIDVGGARPQKTPLTEAELVALSQKK